MSVSNFIEKSKWVFAKTYKESPHEYTVLSWTPERKKDFVDFAKYIIENGKTVYFYGKPYTQLFLGEYKYWFMDDTPEEVTLINRTYIDEKLIVKLRNHIKSNSFFHKRNMCLDDIRKELEND